MSRVDAWWSERPRRTPAEYVCELAAARLWRSETDPFVKTSPEIEETSETFLHLGKELAHALVIVLRELPRAERRSFAEKFYRRRKRGSEWEITGPATELSRAAAIALLVVELTEHPDLRGMRIVDLLTALAQGDDLSSTPDAVVAEIRKIVARIRLDVELEDELDPRSAAATAIVEVIDPSGGAVALQEVLVRAAWAVVKTWEAERVLDFVLAADRILAAPAD